MADALAQRMEQMVRAYIQGCNDADPETISACFVPDAIHHTPVNDLGLESLKSATTIGAGFQRYVHATGKRWTVDQLVTDVGRRLTIMEWTSFNRERDRITRGVDWFEFDPQALLIKSVRSFWAMMPDPDVVRIEQLDFDYAARGYPTL